jgi:hypothetical protein
MVPLDCVPALQVEARYQEAVGALHAMVDALHAGNGGLLARLEAAHGSITEKVSWIGLG